MKITPVDDWTSRKLQTSQPPTLAALRAYQLGKLRETLEHVLANSRFYKEHLRGTDPASVQSMDDVAKLPYTESGMLAERFYDFLCVPPGEISRIVTLPTSGTTGRPKRIAFTSDDQELTIDFFHYGIRTLVDSSDRVLVFLPGKTEGSVGDLLAKALARFGCDSLVFGPVDDCARALKAMIEARASCAVGIPSQLLALSRYGEWALPGGGIQLKSVLLSTDYVAQAVADSLKRTWGCEVYGHYGMTEMGLGGGVECSARNGYHMRDADLLFEIVDPVDGKPVENGKHGEVVFSTLTRQGMPLIRYRTGDRSRFLSEPCPCGSLLNRMERVSGRINEFVRLCDGSFLSIAQLDEIMYRHPGVSSYAAEVCSQDDRDCLVLTVQAAPSAAEQMKSDLAVLFQALAKQGRLRLDVREGEAEFFTTGTSKRFIADRRIRNG